MNATIIHLDKATQVEKYTDYSRLALVIWDIATNLGREVDLVWSHKFCLSSLLYSLVRYPIVVYQIWAVSYTDSTPDCDALDKFTWAVSLFPTRIATIASFVLRVYAVTNRGRFLVALLCISGLLVLVLDVVQMPTFNCRSTAYPLVQTLVFLSLCVFDGLSTAMIGTRMLMLIRHNGGFKPLNFSTMTGLVLTSGITFFIVVTAVQVGAVIMYFLPQGVYSTFLNDYTIVLSAVLVSHFLLDLRELAYHPDQTILTTMQSIRFAGPHKRSTIGIVRDFEDPFNGGNGCMNLVDNNGIEVRCTTTREIYGSSEALEMVEVHGEMTSE